MLSHCSDAYKWVPVSVCVRAFLFVYALGCLVFPSDLLLLRYCFVHVPKCIDLLYRTSTITTDRSPKHTYVRTYAHTQWQRCSLISSHIRERDRGGNEEKSHTRKNDTTQRKIKWTDLLFLRAFRYGSDVERRLNGRTLHEKDVNGKRWGSNGKITTTQKTARF